MSCVISGRFKLVKLPEDKHILQILFFFQNIKLKEISKIGEIELEIKWLKFHETFL